MRETAHTFGGLTCRAVGTDVTPGAADLAVILCHGYGAPGTDLLPLGHEIAALAPKLRERALFVFPETPLAIGPFEQFGGRAWWHLDIEALAHAADSGSIGGFAESAPEGLDEAAEMLTASIEEIVHATGLSVDRTVVGGFSQGSMVALDAALRLRSSPAALAIFSGIAINKAAWESRARHHSGIQVLQTHGRQDPILPFGGALQLGELLREAGLAVEFIEFEGGHTIPARAVSRMAALLGSFTD